MGNIKRKLENLKPGKEYLLTVRAKNADINVTSDYTDSIRFVVPTDLTIPGQIADLTLAANFEKVLFTFTDLSERDIRRYEYELYDNSGMTGTPITGFADSNLFTVSVQNSTDSVVKNYWGRVRGVDTSNNVGDWSDLISSGNTPLITEEYIDSLTANKITAGTIGAHTITLNGANSIIKSSTFDGDVSAIPSYSDATTGWLIDGSGEAYFYNATIVGNISASEINIGGSDETSFHVDTDGNMWSGAGAYSDGRFRVSNEGVARIGKVNSYSITGLSSTGSSVTYTTSTAHEFSVDDLVVISNITPSTYNGTYVITAISGSTFTVESSSTGSVSSYSGATATSSAFFINNDGSINIGSSLGTGNFKISSAGKMDVGGSDASSFHVDTSGRIWAGAASFANAKFRVDGTGIVRIGSAVSAFYVNNDGSVSIGSSLTGGNVKISSTGNIDIGGSDSSSFHIKNDGTVWVGSGLYDTTTTPFIIENDGSLHIGGSDIKSFHITKTGNIIAGATKTSTVTAWRETITNVQRINSTSVRVTVSDPHEFSIGDMVSVTNVVSAVENAFNFVNAEITAVTTYTFTVAYATSSTTYTSGGKYRRIAPFAVTASTGVVRITDLDVAGEFTGTGKNKNLYNVIYMKDTFVTANNNIRGSSHADSYDEGTNYVLNAGSGLRFRTATDIYAKVSVSGVESVEFTRRNLTNLTAYSGGANAYWEDSTTGGVLGKQSSSSIRYKLDVKPLTDVELDYRKLLDIPVVQFKYRDGYLNEKDTRLNKSVPGFIAEDIYKIYPIACDFDKDGNPETWNDRMIIPGLLKLIQDLYGKIDVLESKLKNEG